MVLKKYGQRFYDMDVTVTGMMCLALLDNADPRATEQIEELTSDLDNREYAELFNLEPEEPGEERSVITHECTIEMRHGWLVAADVMRPNFVDFSEDGIVLAYSSSCVFRPVLAYGETLETALNSLVNQAEEFRKMVFSQARKEQGLPER